MRDNKTKINDTQCSKKTPIICELKQVVNTLIDKRFRFSVGLWRCLTITMLVSW